MTSQYTSQMEYPHLKPLDYILPSYHFRVRNLSLGPSPWDLRLASLSLPFPACHASENRELGVGAQIEQPCLPGGPGGRGGGGMNRGGGHGGGPGGHHGGPMGGGPPGGGPMGLGGGRDRIFEKLQAVQGPTFELPPLDMSEKKFNGRARLYIGNLAPEVTEEQLKEILGQYGAVGESFFNGDKGP